MLYLLNKCPINLLKTCIQNLQYLMGQNNHLKMVADIIHTASELDYKISKVLKEFGITHVQFNIIRILERYYPTPLSIGEVKSRIVFSNSDVTRLIDRMEAKGIVSRTVNKENRRKMDVLITLRGLAIAEKIWPSIEDKLDNHYTDIITPSEAKKVSKILNKIRGDD